MLLTAKECRVAAERAKEYPKDYGNQFIAVDPTYEQLIAVVGHSAEGMILTEVGWTLAWLKQFPEHLALG